MTLIEWLRQPCGLPMWQVLASIAAGYVGAALLSRVVRRAVS